MSAVLRISLLSLLAALVAGGAVWLVTGRGRDDPAVRRTLLLTGFGPFGDHESNPAWESARVLDGVSVGRLEVRTARLDVVYATAEAQLREAIQRVQPDLVLCLGVAPGDRIRLEVVARNLDDSAAPDNAGQIRQGLAIRAEGPALLPTRLPVQRLRDALGSDGYEVFTSEDAGGYLCNHVFYRLMDAWPEPRVAGFVHVPVLEGPWDLARLRDAVRRMVEVLDETAGD